MKDNKNKNTKIGIFSFFAGAGFLDLGFETTKGFETVFVNEYHKPFMEVYKATRKNLGIKKPIFGHSTEDLNNKELIQELKEKNLFNKEDEVMLAEFGKSIGVEK